jgi:hypothetical protein
MKTLNPDLNPNMPYTSDDILAYAKKHGLNTTNARFNPMSHVARNGNHSTIESRVQVGRKTILAKATVPFKLGSAACIVGYSPA